MRNLLKYPPLEWRRRDQHCIPQGPSFSGCSASTLTLAGSCLHLRAPRHSPLRRSVKQTRILPGHDVLIDPQLNRYGRGVMANSHWGINCLLSRLWAFYGPWMTGCKGELIFSVSVIGRFNEYRFENLSFLNPKAFEMVLLRYLNERYGHHNWGNEHSHIPRFRGPIDWQRHSHLPVPSASFKVSRGYDPKKLVRPEHIFVFPITDEHFVEICFEQDIYSFDSEYRPAFDVSPMEELQDAIFNSISLVLGPETQAKTEKVKAEVGNMQLSKEFAPLKWPTNIHPPEPSEEMPERPSLQAGN